jgi:hypothetical protein
MSVVAPVVSVHLSTLDAPLTGSVFAHDHASGLVVLHQWPSAPAASGASATTTTTTTAAAGAAATAGDELRTIRIVAERFVTQASVLQGAAAVGAAPQIDTGAALVPLSTERLLEREAKQLARQKNNARRLNPHASPLAQALFHSLAKTMPVRWAEANAIVVFEEKFTVVVSDPYSDADVVGADEPSVARVKVVLKGERAKLRQ